MLIAMMMTSVVKLRVVNMFGSVVSMTYAILCHTWPVVWMHIGLLIINGTQLYRLWKNKNSDREESHV